MIRASRIARTTGLLAVLVVAALGFILVNPGIRPRPGSGFAESSERRPKASRQLVSIQPMMPMGGEMCEWAPASGFARLAASWHGVRTAQSVSARIVSAAADSDVSVEISRPPLRVISDRNPLFSAIAIEPESGMLMVTDQNLFQLLEFNRLDNTPPHARMTEPKRVIGGPLTKAEMMCAVYIDPRTKEVYVGNGDTQRWLPVFSKDARGNVQPDRFLKVEGAVAGMAVDEQRQELFVTIEADKMVLVYKKTASGNDRPIRRLAGEATQLEGPRGIALDTKRNLLFVSNTGNAHSLKYDADITKSPVQIPGTGRFEPASITVHSLDAQGNTAPLRIIEGPNTQLNVPALMAVDEERGELYVANNTGHSVLVFKVTDSGDVKPARIIKGPKSGIKHPSAVALDLKNRELWVTNFGNHTATVYPLTANGDVAPRRTIRSGPADEVNLLIGNPGAVGYDSRREEILVPN
ncbi:MAG: beta-propeller fold lactonase family protein [Acidobacteria bacterium]|nr:beta-propeller fold lactonase family protein [Acidobacteriota bacterium]